MLHELAGFIFLFLPPTEAFFEIALDIVIVERGKIELSEDPFAAIHPETQHAGLFRLLLFGRKKLCTTSDHDLPKIKAFPDQFIQASFIIMQSLWIFIKSIQQ